MFDPDDLDRPDMPLFGFFDGVVLNNEDPLQLGRIRATIPGLMDEGSGWALPAGTVGGGERNKGFFAVPEKNSEVLIFFVRGNPDDPRYLGSCWGRPTDGIADVPQSARDKGVANTPKVRVFQSGTFELVFDENEPPTFRVKHVVLGTEISIDGLTGSVSIDSPTNISISAVGQISIDGLAVTINGIPAGSGEL